MVLSCKIVVHPRPLRTGRTALEIKVTDLMYFRLTGCVPIGGNTFPDPTSLLARERTPSYTAKIRRGWDEKHESELQL